MTTYEELLNQFGYCEGMVGADIDGDNVIVTIDKESAEVKTLQTNGWIRINTYYPDGTQDEAYRK